MTDPTQSVIWSNSFFGNGRGPVVRGPFGNWGAINPQRRILRNIGNGPLFSYSGVNAILNRTRNSQIMIPLAMADSNLEQQHGGPHQFVGGTMNNLNEAAFDPIFFSHHTYVDYIWERFRIGQQNVGIDPQSDFSFDPNDFRFRRQHNPNAFAGFTAVGSFNSVLGMSLQSITQIVGNSNAFFNLVEYVETPECPDCNDSQYLYCNNNINPPRCVSRSIGEIHEPNQPIKVEAILQCQQHRLAQDLPRAKLVHRHLVHNIPHQPLKVEAVL